MTNHALTLSNVSFAYPGSPAIFSNLTLKVSRGEQIFISGPSGSGKTTLLNLIGGVLLPHEGEIEILGKSLTSMSSARRDSFRAESLGIIFQLFNLIPYLSVLENVLLPLHFSAKRRERIEGEFENEATALLECLGLDKKTIHHKNCAKLSVGQQQRVAAARALIGSPEVIIADEPTSALDYDRRREFIDLLFNQCKEKNTTLLFVSHDKTLESLFSKTFSLTEVL